MVFSQHLVYNRKSGFETAAFSLPITFFGTSLDEKSRLVEMAGKKLNLMKTYLSRFWEYYRKSTALQKKLFAAQEKKLFLMNSL